jgi:hypothetical protein
MSAARGDKGSYAASSWARKGPRQFLRASTSRLVYEFQTIVDIYNDDRMFNGTTGAGYETVHSMKSRLVMVIPEEHYTIHTVGPSLVYIGGNAAHSLDQSVNLAYTVWTHKGKDGKSETRYQYHEESLHDSVLRLGLLKAYDEFKVSLSPVSLPYTHRIRIAPLRHFRVPVIQRKKCSTA